MSKPTKPTLQTVNEEIFTLCAFRYALGRMTYVVGSVVESIIRMKSQLTANACTVMIRDIDEAEQRNALGMNCDREDWLMLREVLKRRLEELNNETA